MQQPVPSRRRVGPLATAATIGVVFVLIIAACGSDDSDQQEPETGADAVTIELDADTSTQEVFGSFRVAEGGVTVGCTAGRFFSSPPQDDGTVSATLTCESGPGEGELKLRFEPTPVAGAVDEFEGPWSFEPGTGDFADLTGGGELTAQSDPAAGTINQTMTGEVVAGD